MFVIEATGLLEMVEQGTFDLIYHEHLSYLALRPLETLFRDHGLSIRDVETTPIHGGSIRVFVQRVGVSAESDEGLDMARYRLDARWGTEEAAITDGTLFGLRYQAENTAVFLREAIAIQEGEGGVLGYGAPAKATVLINYAGLTSAEMPLVADDSPLKQGRFIPGTDIAIVAPDIAFPHNDGESQNDLPVAVIWPWNVAQDIIPKLRGKASAAIIPMPTVRVVDIGLLEEKPE